MEAPHLRLAAYVRDAGISKAELGRRLECSDVMVGYVLDGDRVPGTSIAQAIERETTEWDGGVIRTEEWAAVADEKRRAKKKARQAADDGEPTKGAA